MAMHDTGGLAWQHDHCITLRADNQTSEDSRLEDPTDILEEVQLAGVTAGCIPFRVWFQVLQHRQSRNL